MLMVNSAWVGHEQFADWIVGHLQPATIVELGVHGGFSYFAFCEAVKSRSLETLCYGIDTWEGDPLTGFYGAEIYEEVAERNRDYQPFSTLVQDTFDNQDGNWPDGSIDILHIDGSHTYDAVSNDFTRWYPKMSQRGVMLFHDIDVTTPDFGVWRLWGQLRRDYPTFSFHHSYGLGVLGGIDVIEAVREQFG